MEVKMSDFLSTYQKEGEIIKPIEVGLNDLLPQFKDIKFLTEPAHPTFGTLSDEAKKRIVQSELGYGLFKIGDHDAELAPSQEEKAAVLALIKKDKTS